MAKEWKQMEDALRTNQERAQEFDREREKEIKGWKKRLANLHEKLKEF